MPEFGIKFIRKKSFFHRIHPMNKLAYIISMGIMIFVTYNITLLFILIIISIFTAFVLARMSLREFLKPWKFLAPLVIGWVVLAPFTMGGQTNVGVIASLRWIAFSITFFAFIWATHPRDLVQALAEAGAPYTIAHALETAFTFLPVIDYETIIISYSQRIRQVGSGKNILQATWERMIKLMITMLLRGMKHAQTLAIAMSSRGYGAYKKRTYMSKLDRPISGKIFQYLMIVLAIIWIVYVIILRLG